MCSRFFLVSATQRPSIKRHSDVEGGVAGIEGSLSSSLVDVAVQPPELQVDRKTTWVVLDAGSPSTTPATGDPITVFSEAFWSSR